MSSSFKDKLEQLHGSRKRAKKRAEQEGENEGVYTADDAVEYAEPPSESTAHQETPPPEPPPTNQNEKKEKKEEEPPDSEVGQKLARAYSLRSKGSTEASQTEDPSTGEGTTSAQSVSRETSASRVDSGNEPLAPNERGERLRKEVEKDLAGGKWDEALPLLHELVALLPRHPYGLEKLAEYHRRRGDHELVKHYEGRLRDVMPF